MKKFIKLNVVSILYAFFILIPLELAVNVYRISRLTGWDINTVNKISLASAIIEMCLGTLVLYFLTKKWLGRGGSNYFTVILWIPYLMLLFYTFSFLFPITDRADNPNPASGLIAIGAIFLYPIYILIINFISFLTDYE